MSKLIINVGIREGIMDNDSLTAEEKKWFESLKRCMKKKPDTIEVLVHENYNSESALGSELHLFKKGEINKTQTEAGDLVSYDPAEHSLESFSCDRVAANNHGY